jgi:hypothetical protein
LTITVLAFDSATVEPREGYIAHHVVCPRALSLPRHHMSVVHLEVCGDPPPCQKNPCMSANRPGPSRRCCTSIAYDAHNRSGSSAHRWGQVASAKYPSTIASRELEVQGFQGARAHVVRVMHVSRRLIGSSVRLVPSWAFSEVENVFTRFQQTKLQLPPGSGIITRQ